MSDPNINDVFKLLDEWRHLPDYQLERRADIYFALFLPKVLERHYEDVYPGIKFNSEVIPEFPLRLNTLYDSRHGKEDSVKADYAAFTEGPQKVFLIELKTDMKSLDDKQYNHLQKAVDAGLHKLVEGVLCISRVKRQKKNAHHTKKYVHLLKHLSDLGLVCVPPQVYDKHRQGSDDDLLAALKEVKADLVVGKYERPQVVYILPECNDGKYKGADCISFDKFAGIVENERGELGKRFAKSLREWAKCEAGSAK